MTVYEFDEAVRDGQPLSFIVMEDVAGQALIQALKDASVFAALEVVLQITDALAEAHSRGIVHRDIKPSNVLVTGDGRED